MKRLFFVLSLVLVCSSIFSQEKEWKVKGVEPQIRLSFDEGVDYPKNFSFGADFVAAYRFNEIIRLGAGVGVDMSICASKNRNTSVTRSTTRTTKPQ